MNQPHALSSQQLAYFHTFGFLALPGLMADRIQAITAAFEEVFASHGGGHSGKPHDGKARSCLVPFIDQHDLLSNLLDEPRILEVAKSLIGDDFNYMGSDGNYYVGDTAWHSDGWHASVMHIKFAFYLDKLDAGTGALRVIPGSHHIGDRYAESLQKQARQSSDAFGISGAQVPAVALATTPGDVLVFNHNTKHAAFGGGNRRRMFTINACQRYPQEKLQELRDYMNGFSRFWLERVYGPAMLRTATPQRWTHLEQVHANDGHLAELSRKARAASAEPSRG